jgi:hypothetical protein
MKILTILNDESKHEHIEILVNLEEECDVEVVCLVDDSHDYSEIVKKIEQCDKVLSW